MDLITGNSSTVGVVVAHPDDETLWAGGTLLMHPDWDCYIYTLCRASDADRAERFGKLLRELGVSGRMADLDDGVEQHPLADELVQQTLLQLLDGREFDLLFTHSPWGEYTYHLRHIEISRAVSELWAENKIRASRLCFFAYSDDQRQHLPLAREDAETTTKLPPKVWERKCSLIREVFGFSADSWEARTTPAVEAFWCFSTPEEMQSWMLHKEESQ